MATIPNTMKLASRATDYVSVSQFGAVGDGITDDTTAIQAAVDTGYSVYFPKGTYLVSDSLILGDLTTARNTVRYYADSQGTTIKGTTGISGKPLFKIEGGTSNQQYGIRIEGFNIDLNGAAIGIDFLRGCYTSAVRDVRITDSTTTASVIGIRVYNSFNITIENVQTVGINGNAVKYVARSAETGFSNITNCKIKDCIFQNQALSQVVNLVEFDLDTAADTITIENTALKADATGSKCVYVDGFINQLSLKSLHIESSDTGLASADAKVIYATCEDVLFTDVAYAFDWDATGQIILNNTRFINGTGNKVFQKMDADVDIVGQFLVASASYTAAPVAGTGRIRRARQSMVATGTTRTVVRHEDNYVFYNTAGTLALTLPATDEVGEGFKVAAIRRAGNVTLTPDAADRILGVSGTSAGATVTISAAGDFIEITSQNTIGGSQPFWVVTSLNGTAATP